MANKEKINSYVANPEVQGIFEAIKTSAQVIDGASKTVDFLAKPEVKDLLLKRLPSIASKLTKLTSFAAALGPAGAALGLAVDVLAAFGLVEKEDPINSKLAEISKDVRGLRDDVQKGFAKIQTKLDIVQALLQFLKVFNKLKAKLDIYEENLQNYERLQSMAENYTPDHIVGDLRELHNLIVGANEFGDPLFQQLAKARVHYQGDEFDNFMMTLLNQFHFVIALEIRSIHMLQSFIVLREEGRRFKHDIITAVKNIGLHREKYDPTPYFQWYLDFIMKGGKYEMRAATEPYHYLYFKNSDPRYVRSWETEPGPQGQLNLVPCKSGVGFYVTSRTFTGEFMKPNTCSDGDYIVSSTDINDPLCHILFRVKNVDEKVFSFSPVQSPSQYIYFKSNGYAALGDKTKETLFKLVPFDWI